MDDERGEPREMTEAELQLFDDQGVRPEWMRGSKLFVEKVPSRGLHLPITSDSMPETQIIETSEIHKETETSEAAKEKLANTAKLNIQRYRELMKIIGPIKEKQQLVTSQEGITQFDIEVPFALAHEERGIYVYFVTHKAKLVEAGLGEIADNYFELRRSAEIGPEA